LRAGRIDVAAAKLDDIEPAAGRDAMLAAGLRAAVAMRGDEPAGLPDVYQAAIASYRECPPDVFAPGLAAEVAHLAARVGGDPSRVLAPLEELSGRLGHPPTIAVQLAWAGLLVAVAADDTKAARAAADELASVASGPTRLLADAAGAFADVLDGRVVADAIRELAVRMVEGGLVFEASRLVGAAGIRSTDPGAARSLLADLRRLRATQVRHGGVRPRAVAELSEREREVARGVLDGRTHREIGAELFISAKTVEHHVARIRQKLGAGTKAELLSAIREELARTVAS
jgi:DNA-binding CsgD family transcriptional regulator